MTHSTVQGFAVDHSDRKQAIQPSNAFSIPQPGEIVIAQVKLVSATSIHTAILAKSGKVYKHGQLFGCLRLSDITSDFKQKGDLRVHEVFTQGRYLLCRVLTIGSPYMLSMVEEGMGLFDPTIIAAIRGEPALV